MAEDTIWVKGAKPGVVGLWEIDAAHPTGEVFVTDKHAVEAAETAGVMEALAAGRLIKAKSSEGKATATETAAEENAQVEADRAAQEKAAAEKAELERAAAAQAAAEKEAADQKKAEVAAAKQK